MSGEFGTEGNERLMCIERYRLVSVNDVLGSAREHGDYYFEKDHDPKDPVFWKLINKEEAMANRDCTCHFLPCRIVDNAFVGVDGMELVFSSRDEQFEAVFVVKRCPNDDTIIGTSRYRAKTRTIIGQGVKEKDIKLAYLV